MHHQTLSFHECSTHKIALATMADDAASADPASRTNDVVEGEIVVDEPVADSDRRILQFQYELIDDKRLHDNIKTAANRDPATDETGASRRSAVLVARRRWTRPSLRRRTGHRQPNGVPSQPTTTAPPPKSPPQQQPAVLGTRQR